MTASQFVAAVAVVIVASFCYAEAKMTVLYYGSYPDSGPNQIGNWLKSAMGQKPGRCPGKALQDVRANKIELDGARWRLFWWYQANTTWPASVTDILEENPVIELDGARWRLFWWYQANTTWPASVTDILEDNYGDCDVDSPYCFSRLPDALQEDGAEILANDSAGTVYRWAFDASNDVAHAAWGAFHDGLEATLRNKDDWDPTVVQGTDPKTQDSFQYKVEVGVKSLMLADINCDCDSTLSMGHAMCDNPDDAFHGAVFGVDLLNHEESCSIHLHLPLPTNGLSIYFKDVDDCIDAECPAGSRCLDGINSFTCLETESNVINQKLRT